MNGSLSIGRSASVWAAPFLMRPVNNIQPVNVATVDDGAATGDGFSNLRAEQPMEAG